ncbi:phosphatidate phosphatase LPIN3 isoform X3 [Macrotis lagotis]|uniref:phosphatidate phosphatase LPIN3 isoform X3 n=1 Tax=Macrotis lagotis TaxID=92651 RepID=UPI003D68F981
MNYVGQLAESVLVTVKELYQGLNPATLSGGIDVLVVKQPDGSFLCSPFHVRFGKLGVLRSHEQVVDIEINGEPVDLQMKLGDNGEAFFVKPLDSSEEEVSDSLRTSPIPLDNLNEILNDPLLDLFEDGSRHNSGISTIFQEKKKRRRKKVKKKSKMVTALSPNTSSEDLHEIHNVMLQKKCSEISSSLSEINLGNKLWSKPSCSDLNLLKATVVGKKSVGHLSNPTLDPEISIELSLCGGLTESRDIPPEKFAKYAISYQDLTDNPGILEDPNLVVKIGKEHYNWAVSAPMILSLQAFQKSLPESTIDKLMKEKMSKKSTRWWFSWVARDAISEKNDVQEMTATSVAPTSRQNFIQQEHKTSFVENDPFSKPVVNVPSSLPQTPTFKKSLRLSSNQIRDLNLKEGANDVIFSVTTQYQGTCCCHANIYLWNWFDKVVISDIDGTITKSDALGHILPQLGKDWTHHGIIKLYHKIHLNGYKFLYCSARSIGMAELTKGYLKWVNEQGFALPKGPLLLTPSSLFSALHREVIERKPEVFKIECLTDIHNLFLPHGDPFFAGFGNRPSDVFAYLHVEIPKSRIFTVNPQGELIQELIKNHKTSYDRLRDSVELMFPPITAGPTVQMVDPEFSQFCFWRDPLLKIHLKDLESLLD